LPAGKKRDAKCTSTYCPLVGQGATEYLVLLAVVLIVALVSVALLGFFPSMASDAQATQSQMYWRSASPIAITEWIVKAASANGGTYPYFVVKNNGAYPIRITGIVGGDSTKITQFYSNGRCLSAAYYNMSDYYYLAPGEEKYFATGWAYSLACDREIVFSTGASVLRVIGGATSLCMNSTSSPGTLVLPSMGFEYVEYIENQQITKRQIGKQVVIKCGAPV